MKQYIHTTKEDREFLMKVFGCTERSVFNAIMFDEKRGFTEQAKKIRKVAMERGGILMTVSQSVETLHDHDNVMRQYFPNGALLEADKTSGDVVVTDRHGEQRMYVANVSISGLERIQKFASALR